jgi:DNA-binding transcriptional MerR regulator
MALLSPTELSRIESKYPDGIGSSIVVSLFQKKGERFSEATLRKYVQLGLLPKSRRVGSRGRHRGSRGSYPVAIVRMINDIKTALEAGATLEQIRLSTVGLSGEVDTLNRVANHVLDRFDEAIEQGDATIRADLKKDLAASRKTIQNEIRELEKLAGRLTSGK